MVVQTRDGAYTPHYRIYSELYMVNKIYSHSQYECMLKMCALNIFFSSSLLSTALSTISFSLFL